MLPQGGHRVGLVILFLGCALLYGFVAMTVVFVTWLGLFVKDDLEATALGTASFVAAISSAGAAIGLAARSPVGRVFAEITALGLIGLSTTLGLPTLLMLPAFRAPFYLLVAVPAVVALILLKQPRGSSS